jgi:hypothetical protein
LIEIALRIIGLESALLTQLPHSRLSLALPTRWQQHPTQQQHKELLPELATPDLKGNQVIQNRRTAQQQYDLAAISIGLSVSFWG